MLTREQKFGQVIGILVVLSERVFEKYTTPLAAYPQQKILQNPSKAVAHMHELVMQRAHKFGEYELILLDILSEKMDQLDFDEFDNKPLDSTYWVSQSAQTHLINSGMSVKQAAELWGYKTVSHIRQMCVDGKIKATKQGRDWWIDRNQPNPRKGVDEIGD